MPRFFVEEMPEETVVITGEDAVHIGRSLRMRTGEHLTVCCQGTDFECEITGITPASVMCRVLESRRSPAEPQIDVTLFMALPKSDKMELIIQKSVELGVSRIVPVLTARCISRPDSKSMTGKILRWQKIALSAAKQSGRGMIPSVMPMISFSECLAEAQKLDRAFFCYEKGGESLSKLWQDGDRTVGMVIGPEGGFEDHEALSAQESGLLVTSLGRRILRCETAPLAAISALMLLSGDL